MGGVVASTTWTYSELPDEPPSFVAYTAYQYVLSGVGPAS